MFYCGVGGVTVVNTYNCVKGRLMGCLHSGCGVRPSACSVFTTSLSGCGRISLASGGSMGGVSLGISCVFSFTNLAKACTNFRGCRLCGSVGRLKLLGLLSTVGASPCHPGVVCPSAHLICGNVSGPLGRSSRGRAGAVCTIGGLTYRNVLRTCGTDFSVPCAIFEVYVPCNGLLSASCDFKAMKFFVGRTGSNGSVALCKKKSIGHAFARVRSLYCRVMGKTFGPGDGKRVCGVNNRALSLGRTTRVVTRGCSSGIISMP